MGRGAGGKGSEIVLGFSGGGVFWRARWKIRYDLVAFVFLQGKTTKERRVQLRRRDCDFVNISTKTLDRRPLKLNGIRCSAFNLCQEKKKQLFTK